SDGAFQTADNYKPGTTPISVAVGDFNGDNKPDLAVVNQGSGNVSVLIGQGDGTFQAAFKYEAGSVPWFVAVADLNGDHKPDLVVVGGGPGISGGLVRVLIGTGDGTFHDGVSYSLGLGYLFSVAVADLNSDGKLDLVVAGTDDNSIWVLMGKGDGAFQTAAKYGAGATPVSVAVGDFNGDGKLDLAVANGFSTSIHGTVSVLLGKGDGSFQAAVSYGAGTDPRSV